MSKFIIRGGNKLSGKWQVQGMKNAASPVLAATLLTREPCTIHTIPRISDLDHMIAILHSFGAQTTWKDEHTLRVETPKIITSKMDYLLTKRMRSSVLFMGPLLATMGEVTMPEPGGCNIGNRPLDAHFEGFKALGAHIEPEDDRYFTINGENMQGSICELTERSVTATENIMMLACLIPGTTVIKNAAREPHVACLGRFLRAMGADISGEGTEKITIIGVKKLSGVEFSIIPDQLEIGTIAVLAALTADELTIGPVVQEDVAVVAEKLRAAGVLLRESGDTWVVKNSVRKLKSFTITTAPYPGFPTDLQAPFGVLATQANGTSTIHDPMYENRLGYIEELIKMGTEAYIKDAHTATIHGPTELKGNVIHSLDLRAGATLIIAGLIAQGETILCEAENIDRGYEKIDERLRAIGADITRVD